MRNRSRILDAQVVGPVSAHDFARFDSEETPVRSIAGRMFGVKIYRGHYSVRDAGMPCDSLIEVSRKLGFIVRSQTDLGRIMNARNHVDQVAAVLHAIGLPVLQTRDPKHLDRGEVAITDTVSVSVSNTGDMFVIVREGGSVRPGDDRHAFPKLFGDLRDALGIPPEAALRMPD
jgi:hypothetical protein